jgi:hypothetical protein
MTIRGHVQGGIVVLDDASQLPDGATVEVRVVEPPPKASNREALRRYMGIVDDLPPDASANVDRILYGTPPE